MKSFFIFLSRNKGYTLINFFGLSVSLPFSIATVPVLTISIMPYGAMTSSNLQS